MESVERRTLFVGNLSQEVNEALLYELCMQVGPVENVVLARAKKPREEGKKKPDHTATSSTSDDGTKFVMYNSAGFVPSTPVRREEEVAYIEVRGCFYFIQNNVWPTAAIQAAAELSKKTVTAVDENAEVEKSEVDAKQLEKGTDKEEEENGVEEPKDDRDSEEKEVKIDDTELIDAGDKLVSETAQPTEKETVNEIEQVSNKPNKIEDAASTQEQDKNSQEKELNPNRHLGYGFVLFEHECSVPYAIHLFKGTELFGRRLTLQFRNNKNGAKQNRVEPENNITTRQQPDNNYYNNSRYQPDNNYYNNARYQPDNNHSNYNSARYQPDNNYNNARYQPDNNYTARWDQMGNTNAHMRGNPNRGKPIFHFHDARLNTYQGPRWGGARGITKSYWNDRQAYPGPVNRDNFRHANGNRERNARQNEYAYTARREEADYENFLGRKYVERGSKMGNGGGYEVDYHDQEQATVKKVSELNIQEQKAMVNDIRRPARREVAVDIDVDGRKERRTHDFERRRSGRPTYEDYLLKYTQGETEANARKKPSECFVKLSESFDAALDKFKSAKLKEDGKESEAAKTRRRKYRKK